MIDELNLFVAILRVDIGLGFGRCGNAADQIECEPANNRGIVRQPPRAGGGPSEAIPERND